MFVMILPLLQIALNSSGNHFENFSFLLLVEKEITINVTLKKFKEKWNQTEIHIYTNHFIEILSQLL